jgi:single-stranded-DNA-specific exonuclease
MNWHFKPKAPENFIKQFPEYSPLVLQLLYDRGLKTQSQIDEFFNPDYEEDLHDPFLMKGMKKGVKRIIKAIKKKEKIIVYGDYDADGVCSSVILIAALKALGAQNLAVYIPDRSKEGYGLNLKAVKDLADQGAQLIIALDCGITNFKEIELAHSLGIEVIIVDHHRCPEKLPAAKVIIDPHQSGDRYPFKDLAAAGVAFKLVQALLLSRTTFKGQFSEVCTQDGFEKWLLDLVALATIADMMPLLGENRTLVKYGLGVLAQTKRIGLQELMKVVRLNPMVTQPSVNGEPPLTNLDACTLGYILAPRLNVASRLIHANAAYQLLITESVEEAKEIAERLDVLNRQRQQLVNEIIKQVEKRLMEKDKMEKVIFEGDPQWPVGIVGLVASKISEKYHRPTFIFNLTNNEARGSARGIPNFDIIQAISQCATWLEDFGGHPGAAGLTVLRKNLDAFKKQLSSIADQRLKDEDLIPSIEIDAQLSPEEISWQHYEQVQRFAPFGQANPTPKFLIQDLEINDLRIVGNNGKHLKIELRGLSLKTSPRMNPEGGIEKKFKAIGFGLGERAEELKIGDKIDLVFEFIINEWNGTRDLQMKIIDFKKFSTV